MPNDGEIDVLLKQGLRDIAVPQPSADFDAHVRSRLRRKETGWQRFWTGSRSMLIPAACSMALTLALFNGPGAPAPGAAAKSRMHAAENVALDRARSLEQDLERIDQDTPSLGGFGVRHRGSRTERSPKPLPHGRSGASEIRGTNLTRNEA